MQVGRGETQDLLKHYDAAVFDLFQVGPGETKDLLKHYNAVEKPVKKVVLTLIPDDPNNKIDIDELPRFTVCAKPSEIFNFNICWICCSCLEITDYFKIMSK